jgi:predicted dehydrogenase
VAAQARLGQLDGRRHLLFEHVSVRARRRADLGASDAVLDADRSEIQTGHELTLFQMGFPSGGLGSFSASFGTHESRRYRVLGDNGSWIDMDPAFGYAGLALTISEIKAGQEQREKIELAQKQQFALELDHFASCVRANRTPYTPGEEGLQDIRVIEAIVAAALDGNRHELPRIDKRDAFRGTSPDAG